MRVLLTTDTIGGVWTFTREHTMGLLAEGHVVALLSLGREPSRGQLAWVDATSAEHPRSFAYVSSVAPLEWMQENATAYSAALPTLLRLIDQVQPDVIHSSQFCFGALPCAVPVIITAHSDVLSWAAACDPATRNSSPWLERYKHMVQRGLDSAAAVIAPTRWMLDALRDGFSVSAATQVIHNGRSLPAEPRAARQMQAVTAGRFWDKAKNLALLTRIESCMPILVAGEVAGEGEHEGVQAAASVRTLGSLDEPALLDLFRQSSVYIAASIYEPFGLAPLEAAQCGCALLLNDIPSFREVWGDAALYFHDALSLSRALGEIAASGEPSATRRRREERAGQLSARRMTDQYLSLYKQVLLDRSCTGREIAVYA